MPSPIGHTARACPARQWPFRVSPPAVRSQDGTADCGRRGAREPRRAHEDGGGSGCVRSGGALTDLDQLGSVPPRRPFRFGVSVRHAACAEDWREKARRVEALGYSTFLVPDHFADTLQPFTPLLAAAEATTTLRVGTYVLNNDYRHPAVVAREAAAVDLFSGGRFELGLGAGNTAAEYEQVGLRFDEPRARIDRLGESVVVLKGLLAGETVDFEGDHYTIRGHRVFPRPNRRPPLLIGGNSRQILELAAREADIVGFSGFMRRRDGEHDLRGFTETGAAERVALVRRAAQERFAELELNALVQHAAVTGDPRAEAEKLEREYGLSADELLRSPFVAVGPAESIVEALQERRERHGFSYWVVFEPVLEALAPVVAHLAGS